MAIHHLRRYFFLLCVTILVSLFMYSYFQFGFKNLQRVQADGVVILENKRNRLEAEISELKLSRVSSKSQLKDYEVDVKLPERVMLASTGLDTTPTLDSRERCHMENCFKFSRCPLDSDFKVFFYSSEIYQSLKDIVWQPLLGSLNRKPYVTEDPARACVFVVLLGETKESEVATDKIRTFLHSLPHWNGNGINHLLITLSARNMDLYVNVDIGRAMVAQSAFPGLPFRHSYDVIVPAIDGNGSKDVWSELPPLVPAHRKFLMSFWGEYIPSSSGAQNYQDTANEIVACLKDLQMKAIDSNLVNNVELSCGSSMAEGSETEWGLCQDTKKRRDVLINSTFALLLVPLDGSLISTTSFQTRLYEALKYGAIPVLLGGTHKRLPYDEVLRWEEAAITLPLARIKDLLFYLKSFVDSDVVQMRHQGRYFWVTYFSTQQHILDTTLALLRTRLQIPASPVRDEPMVSAFNSSTVPSHVTIKEALKPTEAQVLSERFQRNYSRSWVLRSFNMFEDPFSLFPYTPYQHELPSEFKFWGANQINKPNGKVTHKKSSEFSPLLGGNIPQETFTVVLLTYKREAALMAALQRLKGLPFLHKVIVVWNDPSPPSPRLQWPNVGVPLEVLKTKRNSMNNRYLPFTSIETEAVLNLDDDVEISHSYIVFAFRVWRQERDRIVGFFGRFHHWDNNTHKWKYGLAPKKELSFIIPSTSFLHKYYFYLFTYVTPQAIRDYVDKTMNCEDIAMNFVVAHFTRKPPIKVKSKWKRTCPGCKSAISTKSGHYEKRQLCLNYFASVYGYMPLLYTQYSVDSI